jgi:hypothetical protein
MSPALQLVCAASLYMLLALVGRAVIAIRIPQKLGFVEIYAISPVIGLSVMTLVTTYLVKVGVPLSEVSPIIALVISSLSLVVLQASRNRGSRPEGKLPTPAAYLVPLLVAAALIAAPFTIGGYQFTTLRGNGSDALNYVTMADALAHYPLNWILASSKSVLASYSPGLPFAQFLLGYRWSTSAMLAFASSIFGLAPIEFEYAFMLTLMLALFGGLTAILSATGTLTRATVWLPVVFVAGFWGQFVVDSAALAQMSALPIIAVLLAWLLSPPRASDEFFRYGPVVTAILLAGLFFQYPEIIVAYIAGVGVLFVTRCALKYRETSSLSSLGRPIAAFAILVLLLTAPLLRFVIGFAHAQTHFAASKATGWETAYFSWLSNPIRGVWGGGPLLQMGYPMNAAFAVISVAVGMILTIAVFVRALNLARAYKRIESNFAEFSALFVCASGAAGAMLLLAKGNPWAAGKVVSYFAILIPILLAGWMRLIRTNAAPETLASLPSRVLALAILGWVTMNAMFAGGRIAHAADGTDFDRYIVNNGEYRRISAGSIAKTPLIGCALGSRVAIFDPNPSAREYRSDIAEGRGFTVSMPPYPEITNPIENPGADVTLAGRSFDCAFAKADYFDATGLSRGPREGQIFATADSSKYVALAEMSGGYGTDVDPSTERRFAFTGNQDIDLTVVGRTTGYSIELKFCPAVPRSANEAISIYVDIGERRIATFDVTDCADKTIEMRGNAKGFVQTVRISSSDARKTPTHIGSDPRDFRLRVDAVRVSLPDTD